MADTGVVSQWARNFVGSSSAFKEAMALIYQFAPLRAPVLIVGETGTGKELAAHAIHYLSERRAGAFIPVNCGALPEALVESELFGHARGAFTDASHARCGLIRQAAGGTLFLDEVEALPSRGQVSLLRFLQDASFRSVGEEQTRHADVRVVAASNVNLGQLAQRGTFRQDLLFRLDVLSVELPALRDRISDLAQLVPYLLEKAARSAGGGCKRVSEGALGLLSRYPWPGNVRELEHALLRTHLLCAGPTIEADDVRKASPALALLGTSGTALDRSALRVEKMLAVVDVERRFVERALAQTHGNISAAARLCGIERAAFSRMAKRRAAPAAVMA